MRSCVIGGLGFIGAAIVEVLLARGDEVTVLDTRGSQSACDARFAGRVQHVRYDILDDGLFERLRGHVEVYNMAGVLGTSELDDDVVTAVRMNVLGAINVFNAALAAGVARVFHPSKPNVWLNAYTVTKVAAEQFAEMYRRRGLAVASVRLYNVYGPGQHTHPVRKLVPAFALMARRGMPLQVYGDGEQTVDMIHVSDVARLAVAATAAAVPEVIDGGRGVAVTVNEVANLVNAYFGNRGVEHLPMRRGETPGTKLVADTAALRRHFPGFRFAPYVESMHATLEHYAALPEAAVGEAIACLTRTSGPG